MYLTPFSAVSSVGLLRVLPSVLGVPRDFSVLFPADHFEHLHRLQPQRLGDLYKGALGVTPHGTF